MIFKPELVKLILQGKKTQTRRTGETCRYQAGKSYAIQAGSKTARGRLTVLEVRQEPLGAITLKDARKEGFVTTQEFFDYWKSLYRQVDREQLVWVISFVLGDLTDTPRYLSARLGTAHGDYVTNPALGARGEDQALSPADLERYSKLAHARDSQRLGEPLRRQRDEIARALEEMRSSLPSQSGSVRDSVRRLERELAVLNRKLAA